MKQFFYPMTFLTAIALSCCTSNTDQVIDSPEQVSDEIWLHEHEIWQNEVAEIFNYLKYENDSCFYDITKEEAKAKGLSEKVFNWAQRDAKKKNDKIKEAREKGIKLEYHFPQNERNDQ